MSLTFSLATKLSTTNSFLDWWLHMAFGEIALDTASQKYYIDRGSVANDNWRQVHFEVFLKGLAENIMFFWQPHKLASELQAGVPCTVLNIISCRQSARYGTSALNQSRCASRSVCPPHFYIIL
jgi:hypothetical protein